jgi:hypothetical protein
MSEFDPLRAVLREWKTPEPPDALDTRVRAAFRAQVTPSPWSRFWTARITVPVPVLAALVLMLAVVWLVEFRPPAPVERPPGVVTRLEATGFQPLPDGVARAEVVKQ